MTLISGVKRSGGFLFQYLAMLSGALSVITSGMHFGWPSPSLPILLRNDSTIQMTSSDGSWMVVMPIIGSAVNSLLAAALVDKIGRRVSLLITSPLLLVSWLMIAYADSVLVLNLARLIDGVVDGFIYTAWPMYLCEIANPKIRGLLASSTPVSMLIGILLVNIVGSYCTIRNTAFLGAALSVLHFVTFYWMPESPYYYIMLEKYDLARKSLRKLNSTGDVDDELKRLKEAVKEQTHADGKIWDLFTVKSNRRACFIIVILRTAQQLSGLNAITFYAQTIFKEATTVISPIVATTIYFSVQLMMASISCLLVDKTGRRPLLFISMTGSTLCLLVEGVYFYVKNNTDVDVTQFGIVPIVALVGYVVVFNVGMGTIPVLMLGELFPTDVKAFALCLAEIYFSIVVVFVSKCFQITKDEFGMHVPFLAFTAFCVMGLILVAFGVPETKNKTLEEIQDELKGKNK